MSDFAVSAVYPIPPTFTPTGTFSEGRIEHYLDYLESQGARVFMTTAGTSQFDLLTKDEIRQLNSCVAKKSADSPCRFIQGLPRLSAPSLMEEVRRVGWEDHPPDAVMMMFPGRYYNDADVIDFFSIAASLSPVPVFVHCLPMRHGVSGTYHWKRELVAKLKGVDGVVGIKEESMADYSLAFEVSTLADDNFIVIPAGGSARRFCVCHPAGAQTYLAGIGSLLPDVEEQILRAIKSSNMDKARTLIQHYETPLFRAASRIGWHLLLNSCLQMTGLLPGYSRSPFPQLGRDEERQLVDELQFLPWNLQ